MDQLGQQGRPVDDVIADLTAKRSGDVRWADGKTFGMVYDGGPSVHEVAEQAARLYLHENALNTQAFPSLAAIQREVVGWTASLLHGDEQVAGFLTSGGTESILCAVLAARERALAERGVTAPEVVLCESAHAAFHKAAHNFGLVVRKAPVRADFTADVDACMGGFVLPFAEMLGRQVEPWDFRVDGVTTISADIHKLGYAPKGVSVILHRTKESRKYQTFVFGDWLGGFYASPNMQGTRSGLPMACAWAVMQHLGIDGYVALTRQTLLNADTLRAGIATIDGVGVLGDGRFHLVAMAAEPDSGLDMFALGDALLERGWYHDRQQPPDNLHSTVSNTNTGAIEGYLDDLATCVAEVRGTTTDDRSTTYATID